MPAGHRVFAARSVLDGREHGGVLDADGATLIPRGARPSGRSPKSRRPINTGYMWNEDAPLMRGFSPPLTIDTYALLTRPPLGLPLVRLACVKHAASVRSEPGSNSQVHLKSNARMGNPRKRNPNQNIRPSTNRTRTRGQSNHPNSPERPYEQSNLILKRTFNASKIHQQHVPEVDQ